MISAGLGFDCEFGTEETAAAASFSLGCEFGTLEIGLGMPLPTL